MTTLSGAPKAMGSDSNYDNPAFIAEFVNTSRHRDVIGGMWEEIGQLQLDFLRHAGLEPDHALLDVGCGSLRGGVHFVKYLAPDHYYGIDINQPLLDAGYEKEIVPLGLAGRLPRENLARVDDFDATRFGRIFDFVLAVSVFTHINWCRVRQCLDRLVEATRPGSVFYATYFALPEDARPGAPLAHPPAGITTHGHSDPFHYRFSDFRQAARALPWKVENIGEWGHPRGQKMLAFTRTA